MLFGKINTFDGKKTQFSDGKNIIVAGKITILHGQIPASADGSSHFRNKQDELRRPRPFGWRRCGAAPPS